MIAIVDYDAGNIRSVENALSRLGAQYILTNDPEQIKSADHVIIPGVGSANHAMKDLIDKGLVDVIKSLRKPVLGICVGLQIMCIDSEEGNVQCLGIFDAHVKKFNSSDAIKVPHMGWNTISNLDSKLFKNIEEDTYIYFVHSYHPTLSPDTIATCKYGSTTFSAALKYENFYGTQFHPEKSGDIGEQILRNFISL